MRLKSKRAIWFVVIFAILCGTQTTIYTWDGLRAKVKVPDFRNVRSNERVVAIGFSNAMLMQIKLSYFEHGGHYRIGVFADHTGSMFAKEAFPPKLRLDFFNYFMVTSSLPEVRDILYYASENDFLPSDIVIVFLTNPLVGDGLLNLTRRSNLAHKAFFSLNGISASSVGDTLLKFYGLANNVLTQSLDWRAIWSNFLAPTQKSLIIPDTYCVNDSKLANAGTHGNRWSKLLPVSIRYYLGLLNVDDKREMKSILCRNGLPPGYAGDGSELGRADPDNLVRHNWIKENVLQPRHTASIVRSIESINRIVSAAGRIPIFVVPPVLGGTRDSTIERVFSAAMDSLDKDVRLIDHRFRFQERKYFYGDDEHTGILYYKALVKEMIERGWFERLIKYY